MSVNKIKIDEGRALKIAIRTLVIFLVFGGWASAETMNYVYYPPHVLTTAEFYPANDASSNVQILVVESGTNYEVDQDGDGIYELQFTNQNAGIYNSYYNGNHGGTLALGASIRSNKPIQPLMEMWENDYGTYDHTNMKESLLPVSEWASEFIIPTDITYIYIFAKDSTQVTITRPGQLPTIQTISARNNLKLSSILAGTSISADKPVEVMAVNIQTDQNYPWNYNVLPITKIGTEYYYDVSYKEVDDWPETAKLFITAVSDGTIVNIDENNDGLPETTFNLNAKQSTTYANPVKGAHIISNNKVYVVYNEYALHNGKWNGAATELIPVNSYGTNFAIFSQTGYFSRGGMLLSVTASQDDTIINIDNNWDDIPEITTTLNKGDVWKDLKATTPSRHIWSNKGIQVVVRNDWSHPDVRGVTDALIPNNLGSTPADLTAPTIVCGDADGLWHGTDVSITCTATDSDSGLANPGDNSFSLSTNVADGDETINALTNTHDVCDLAGNCATAGPINGNMVDKKAPSISILAPASTYTLNQAIAASYSCSDGGSGVASCDGPVPSGNNFDTSTVGSKSFIVNTKDLAGNTASVTSNYNVIYNWNGFFRPIDNLDLNGKLILNAVKAGSSVPAKFSLNGDQGLGIITPGFPRSSLIACDSNAIVDPIDETVTAGSSSLSYDATADQYIYVWKTDKIWSNTCRQLNVKLVDGTTHVANFKFT